MIVTPTPSVAEYCSEMRSAYLKKQSTDKLRKERAIARLTYSPPIVVESFTQRIVNKIKKTASMFYNGDLISGSLRIRDYRIEWNLVPSSRLGPQYFTLLKYYRGPEKLTVYNCKYLINYQGYQSNIPVPFSIKKYPKDYKPVTKIPVIKPSKLTKIPFHWYFKFK